jgi:hypothetical protein
VPKQYGFRVATLAPNSIGPEAIIELYGGRWNIETTFQEMREYFG